ncbi:MAG: HepT-like ribonuclease domain-containing protein [Gemmatimonadota bacterium]
MTYLVERLEDLRRHLDHLAEIRAQVSDASSLKEDFTLHNDVLFSLLMVTQLVVDVAGELSARRNLTVRSYRQAVENLQSYTEFPGAVVSRLSRLPGFRNVVLHEYVDLDYGLVVEALSDLEPVETFLRICSNLELESAQDEARDVPDPE